MQQLGQVMIFEDGSQRLLIHFVSRQKLPSGKWMVACAPNLTHAEATESRAWPWQRTDDARAVNCPICLESDAYKQALLGAKDKPSPFIHYACPVPGEEQYRIACGTPKNLCRTTDEVRAVTCPECQKMPQFVVAAGHLENATSLAIHLTLERGERPRQACGLIGRLPGSDDARAVTCPACKNSAPFRERYDTLHAAGAIPRR